MSYPKRTIYDIGSKEPMKIRRGESRIRGTHWHHLSHVTWGAVSLDEDLLRDYLQASWNKMRMQRVQVEDPYHKNHFRDDFLIHPETLAVVHRSVAHVAVKGYADLGKFSVVWPYAAVQEGVSIGPATEVRPQARVETGAEVGGGTLINKNAHLRKNTRIGIMVFMGAGVQLGENSEISSGSHISKEVSIGKDVQIFDGGMVERAASLGANGFYDANVSIGHHTWIKDDVIIGAEVKIAPFTTIGSHVMIGAGNTIGDLGANRPTAYVEDRTFIPAAYQGAEGDTSSAF